LIALGGAGCATTGAFVWVDDYASPAPNPKGFTIAPGDVLSVRVFNQDAVSARPKVRRDGFVSLPFLNDVAAAGLTPNELAQVLQSRLKDFINVPVVTVSVEETRPMQIAAVGELARPGSQQLEDGSTLLQALAAVGGLTDFAHRDRIFVVRKQGDELVRIRFAWEHLIHAKGRGPSFRLQGGDVIVAE